MVEGGVGGLRLETVGTRSLNSITFSSLPGFVMCFSPAVHCIAPLRTSCASCESAFEEGAVDDHACFLRADPSGCVYRRSPSSFRLTPSHPASPFLSLFVLERDGE